MSSQCDETIHQFLRECVSPTPIHVLSFYVLLASKFFLLLAPMAQIGVLMFRLCSGKGDTVALSTGFLGLMFVAVCVECISFILVGRFSVIGVWMSLVLVMLFFFMSLLVVLGNFLQWKKRRQWRKKGFLIPNEEVHLLSSSGSVQHGDGTSTGTSQRVLAYHDTRSSFSGQDQYLDSEHVGHYGGLTVDMPSPVRKDTKQGRRLGLTSHLLGWLGYSRPKRRRVPGTPRKDDTEVDDTETFTVKTPQSTQGYYFQTPMSRTSPGGHSFGTESSMRSSPASRSILRFTSPDRNAKVPSSSRNSTPSKQMGRNSHELSIDDILQDSSYKSYNSENLSDGAELMDYDTDDEAATPTKGSRTPPKEDASTCSVQSKASPILSPIRTLRRSKKNRKPVSRKLYTSDNESPCIRESGFSNHADQPKEDNTIYASGLITLLVISFLFISNIQLTQSVPTSSSASPYSIRNVSSPSDLGESQTSFPMSWPPKSAEQMASYGLACMCNLLLILSRLPQIRYILHKKTSEGVSKMMFLCFMLSNLSSAVSSTLFIVDTGDILVHLPWVFGALLCIFIDFFLLFVSMLHTKQLDTSSHFEIFSDNEEDYFVD